MMAIHKIMPKTPWTTRDRAYVAGLLDGEGCFGIYKQPYSRGYYVKVQLNICNLPVIKYISKLTQQPYYSRKRLPSYKRIYRIGWYGQLAQNLIREIYPFLIVKKEQAKLCGKLIKKWSSYSQRIGKRDEQYFHRLWKQVKQLKRLG